MNEILMHDTGQVEADFGQLEVAGSVQDSGEDLELGKEVGAGEDHDLV